MEKQPTNILEEPQADYLKAEDALFVILDDDPTSEAVLDFGVLFYERLRGQGDAALLVGNLPRKEVEVGLAELRRRKSARALAR